MSFVSFSLKQQQTFLSSYCNRTSFKSLQYINKSFTATFQRENLSKHCYHLFNLPFTRNCSSLAANLIQYRQSHGISSCHNKWNSKHLQNPLFFQHLLHCIPFSISNTNNKLSTEKLNVTHLLQKPLNIPFSEHQSNFSTLSSDPHRSFFIPSNHRTFSSGPHPNTKQYVDQARTKVRAWAARRMKASRLFWERRVLLSSQFWEKTKMGNKERYRLKSLLHGQGNRLTMLKENMKSRKVELRKLKERVKEGSKRIREESEKAGRGAITLFKKYGMIGIAVYMCIYVISVMGFFIAASSGWLTTEQVNQCIVKLHLEGHIKSSTLERVDTIGGKLFIAWIAAKIIEPLRLFIAVTITPSVAKFLRQRGVLKK